MQSGRSSILSRALLGVDAWTSKAWVATMLCVASVASFVVVVAGGSNDALAMLVAVIQVVTLVMVFVIQHTQSRDQRITHRKLDELLSADPDADQRMVALERATDAAVDAASRRHLQRSPHA
jgi:low affinity Fe/Cu permease